MDIDFLITTIIYLAFILALHHYLNYIDVDRSLDKKSIFKTNNLKIVSKEIENNSIDNSIEINNENTFSFDTDTVSNKSNNENELILDPTELNDVNSINNDLMKYLQTETEDKNKTLEEITKKNLTFDKNNSLNNYFKENKEKYTFEEVPTTIENKNEVKYNDTSNEILAFDEFSDTPYATIN